MKMSSYLVLLAILSCVWKSNSRGCEGRVRSRCGCQDRSSDRGVVVVRQLVDLRMVGDKSTAVQAELQARGREKEWVR